MSNIKMLLCIYIITKDNYMLALRCVFINMASMDLN